MIIQIEHIEKAEAHFQKAPNTYTTDIKLFMERYPNIVHYIFSDNFALLSKEEREYFEYLAWIQLKAIEYTQVVKDDAQPELIGETEEKHWEILQTTEKLPFRERMTPFFDTYDEEEALAYIEDSLVEDEGFELSKEVKELIVVGLTTITISLLFVK